jgi:hypothetical protein
MSNPIRHVSGILAGLVLALTWLWWAASPASAGGPTSVIMVNPGTGRAAALHTTNPRYMQLVKTLSAYDPPTGSPARPASVSDCSQCEIRLTWLIHDMRIWRIDRVHLTSDDGVWIHTVADESGERDLFDQPGQWQRPYDQATLIALLSASGVISPAAADAANRQPVSVSPQPAVGDANLAKVAGGALGLPVGLVAAGAAVVGMAAGLGLAWLIRRSRSDRDRFQLTG